MVIWWLLKYNKPLHNFAFNQRLKVRRYTLGIKKTFEGLKCYYSKLFTIEPYSFYFVTNVIER